MDVQKMQWDTDVKDETEDVGVFHKVCQLKNN